MKTKILPVTLAAICWLFRGAVAAERPNVLFLMVDDLGRTAKKRSTSIGWRPPACGSPMAMRPAMKLRHEEVTLAEAVRAASYRTAHVGKWHLAPRGVADTPRCCPNYHGFEINIGCGHC